VKHPKGKGPLDPKDLAGAHVLGQAVVISKARDFVDEREIAGKVGGGPEVTHFFVNEGKPYGTPFAEPGKTYERGGAVDVADLCFVMGATVLAATEDGSAWVPVIGARVILRLQTDNFVAFDCCTRGDGSTVRLPEQLVPLHRAEIVRVEVAPPTRFAGRDARCVLHTITQEKVR
jgi:hypothetical protein